MTRIKWSQKYELGLKERLSIKEIMLLRDCGQPTAIEIRNKAIDYCVANDIDFPTKSIPTEAVFAVTKLGLDYYYDKMIQESKCLGYVGA